MADSDFLKVWLPFNSDTTTDNKGNSWTAYNNPTVSDTNAKFGNALQLSGGYKTNSELGQYLQLDGGISLGGQDFTIDFWSFMDSAIGTYARPLAIFNSFGSNGNKALLLEVSGTGLLMRYDGSATSVKSSLKGTLFHAAIVYEHSKTLLSFYVNGTKVGTISKAFPKTEYTYFFIGRANYKASDTYYFKGTIDEFRIYDGIARWTDNFTPPTALDYVNLNFDAQRVITNPLTTWRYENYGTADLLSVSGTTLSDLPATQSKTGSAFFQTARVKCFDIPASNEIWAKFDLYHKSGTSRFRIYDDSNGSTANGFVLTQNSSTQVALWSYNGSANYSRKTFDAVLAANTLQTWLLHMKSGVSDGLLELYCNGVFLGSYTGNVNNGASFQNFFFQSDDSNNLFSNVIISNAQIALDENVAVDTIHFEQSCNLSRFDGQKINVKICERRK